MRTRWIVAACVALGSFELQAANFQMEFDEEMMEASGLGPPEHHWIAESPVGAGAGPVTAQQLTVGSEDASAWLHYGGGYRSWRHSSIETITPETVADLEPV